MKYGFVQSFQQYLDPKQQDQWTTFVEYLAFECLYLDQFTKYTQRMEPQPVKRKGDCGHEGNMTAIDNTKDTQTESVGEQMRSESELARNSQEQKRYRNQLQFTLILFRTKIQESQGKSDLSAVQG